MKKSLLFFVLASTMNLAAQSFQILNCPNTPPAFSDETTNDPALWNQPYFWQNQLATHDMPEASADLSISVSSTNPAGLVFDYQLFLDTDGDGLAETVVGPSILSLPPGYIRYGNVDNPGYSGGVLRKFDGRAVPDSKKYRFRMRKTISGNEATVKAVWASSPGLYFPGKAPKLPYGTHRIKWTVTDANGDSAVCQYVFTIRDGAPPAVVCSNDITASILPSGQFALWATDLLQYATDNNGTAGFKFSICPHGAYSVFPTDVFGNPYTSLSWTCNDLGQQEVDVWAQDVFGNASYCTATFTLQDFAGNCENNSGVPVCAQNWCNHEGIEEVSFNLQSTTPPPPGLPPIWYFWLSADNGCTSFPLNAIPLSSDFTLTAFKDDNPLNGVGTYDLLLIKLHLDGTQPFTQAWQYIAADVNNDGVVSGADTIELKNLITGIYTELPNNTSWRFFADTCDFSAPYPISCPEEIQVVNFNSGAYTDLGFYGIKIGDLNCTSIANNVQPPSERQNDSENRPIILGARPNPVKDAALVPVFVGETTTGYCELFDLNGRLVWSRQTDIQTGWQNVELPAEAFPQSGVYAWRVRVDTSVATGKLVKE